MVLVKYLMKFETMRFCGSGIIPVVVVVVVVVVVDDDAVVVILLLFTENLFSIESE